MSHREPPCDLPTAHRWFSASFFNAAWDWMERSPRSPEDDERMISLCHASLCHWRERDDCRRVNLSVGYWQAARVYTLAGRTSEARHYAELCLNHSLEEGPFYLGYAHEALARAAQLAGNDDLCRQHVAEARRLATQIEDSDARAALEADLTSLS
ncbi:MAG: hypothetical protein U0935_24055 [Pirellulales bacterium]